MNFEQSGLSDLFGLHTDIEREQQRQCRTCRNTLDRSLDHKKTRNSWWTNCQRCRDKRTARRRQQKDALSMNNRGSQIRNATATECSVCADNYLEPDLARLSGCAHQPDVCRNCFAQWLETQLEVATWENVQCPSNGCGQSITHEDVRAFVPESLFARCDIFRRVL